MAAPKKKAPAGRKKPGKPSPPRPVKDPSVHRPLHLSTPNQRGADVKRFQASVNEKAKAHGLDEQTKVDGVVGQHTIDVARDVAFTMGVRKPALKKLHHGQVGPAVQKLIRDQRDKTPVEKAISTARKPGIERLQAKRSDGIAKEMAFYESIAGMSENPAGSNLGPGHPGITEFEKFLGYDVPPGVFWCGCLMGFVSITEGGVIVASRIRLGYGPSIIADAKAGSNGLRAIPAAVADAGDCGTLWGGDHIVKIRGKVKNGLVPTWEGNTTANPGAGSENNGGYVEPKVRSASDFDVFARFTVRR